MKAKISQIKERLLRNPKVFYIAALFLFSVIVTLLSVFLDPTRQYDPDRHQYDPETRVSGSRSFLSDAFVVISPPEQSFIAEVVSADLIIEGKVLDEGTLVSRYLPVNEGEDPTASPQLYSVDFQIQVRDVWYGECEDTEITLGLLGGFESGVTKPHKDDELILFLSQKSNGDYTTVFYEESIYVINPPENKIFVFADNPSLIEGYDHTSISFIKREVKRILREVDSYSLEEYPSMNFIGDIANGFLSDDHPLKRAESEETE